MLRVRRTDPRSAGSSLLARAKSPRFLYSLAAALCGVSSTPGQSLLQSFPPTVGTNQGVGGFCVVGDVNGDGVPDFATGHPSFNPGLGAVRIYAGGTGALLGERTAVSLGVTDQTGLGYTLETLGDVTGDGIPEFLAGISSSGTIFGAPVPGRAVVISPVGMSLVLMLTGSEPADLFGLGLGGFTDVDGDGVPDPLIGAPSADPGGVFSAGEARAFNVFTGSPLLYLTGSAVLDEVGSGFAAMGDLDGDGKDDFAVDHLVPFWEALVVSGGTGLTLYSIPGLGQYFFPMASIGDLDSDGAREIVTRSSSGGLQAITVFSWGSPILTYTVPPVSNLLNFGLQIASAGDVDGDGFDDVVVGADASVPPTGGTLFYGAFVVVSGATGIALQQVNGPYPFGGMGHRVRGAGDVNGDGLADVAVYDLGRVEVWSLVPIGVSIDGGACPGSGGLRPVIGITGAPTLGSSVSINLSQASQAAAALLMFGLPANSWGGIPLPVDLAFLGLPGCNLAVPISGTIGTFTGPLPGSGIGGVSLPLTIRPDPSLVGGSIAFQWYAADPGPGPFPGVTTRRLVATIQ
ncbi:MAG TPA: FG-GAP repeat protein [Planctomycetota bacterium]|nr:FG-GAP repeat protein [Planctomycetota bacterium]